MNPLPFTIRSFADCGRDCILGIISLSICAGTCLNTINPFPFQPLLRIGKPALRAIISIPKFIFITFAPSEPCIELQKDQSKAAENGVLGGYEQSDFLWGKATDVAPTERVIRLPLRHRMSSARVTLKEGTGFAKDEWLKLEKQVLVMNTRRTAEINLATGEVKATGEVAKTGTLPYRKDQDFRAIVVPQTVESGKVLFNITVNGTAYTFKRAEAMTYLSGKMHNFTIEVNKKAESGEYEFKLAGESITAWENDDISHDATAKEYIIIDVPKAGTLKECIQAANKDFTKVMNLKLTGHINAYDFFFMRNEMAKLQSLNLKEVKIDACEGTDQFGNPYEADMIPIFAMTKKSSLQPGPTDLSW